MHIYSMPPASKTYEPTQALECVRMLNDLVRSPEKYETWFERFASGLTFRVGFGKVLTHDDKNEYLRRIMEVVHTVERVASPGSCFVDTFPSLMYLPSRNSWPRSRGNSGSSTTRS